MNRRFRVRWPKLAGNPSAVDGQRQRETGIGGVDCPVGVEALDCDGARCDRLLAAEDFNIPADDDRLARK